MHFSFRNINKKWIMVILLFILTIFLIIVSFSLGKYKSTFSSHFSLNATPEPTTSGFQVICSPWICNTSPDPASPNKFFPKKIEGLQAGDVVSVNSWVPYSKSDGTDDWEKMRKELVANHILFKEDFQNGGYYGLKFDSPEGLKHTINPSYYGAIPNWYDLKNNWYDEDDENDHIIVDRWIDNINYMFEPFGRRWLFASDIEKDENNNPKLDYYGNVIPKGSTKKIKPDESFTIPQGVEGGYFIAYLTAHWSMDALRDDSSAWTRRKIANNPGEFWGRYNVEYTEDASGKIISPDRINLTISSGQNDGAEFFELTNLSGGNVNINGWNYDSVLSIKATEAFSPGGGGPFIRIDCDKSQLPKRIKSIAFVMQTTDSKTDIPIIKVWNDKSKFDSEFCRSGGVETNDVFVLQIEVPEGSRWEAVFEESEVDYLDIYFSGDISVLNSFKLYGMYIDWETSGPKEGQGLGDKLFDDYTDGLFYDKVNSGVKWKQVKSTTGW